jgi:D-threo-aldose 1-dehydrogenase
MDPFASRTLGKTELKLPSLGLGGAPLGNSSGVVSDPQSDATLATAWDSGIRFYDTSPFYGRGLSEHRIGRLLRNYPKSESILTTKIGRVFRAPDDPVAFARSVRSWPEGLHFEFKHDYSYDGIMRSYEDSLQRLGLNRVDALLIHDLDLGAIGDEAQVTAHFGTLVRTGIHALNELKSTGLIKAIGAGINRTGTIPRFLDVLDIDFFLVAGPYTLADQPGLDAEFPLCEKRGVGLVIGQVFASGILATGPVPGARYGYSQAPREILERVSRMQAICLKHDVPLAAAALQFPLHHPLVAAVIPGAFAPEQVARNIETMRVEIPPQLWHDLKVDGLLRDDAPTP